MSPSFKSFLPFQNLWNILGYYCLLRDQIPLKAPWQAPKAQEWDITTVKEFLDRTCWTRYVLDPSIRLPTPGQVFWETKLFSRCPSSLFLDLLLHLPKGGSMWTWHQNLMRFLCCGCFGMWRDAEEPWESFPMKMVVRFVSRQSFMDCGNTQRGNTQSGNSQRVNSHRSSIHIPWDVRMLYALKVWTTSFVSFCLVNIMRTIKFKMFIANILKLQEKDAQLSHSALKVLVTLTISRSS